MQRPPRRERERERQEEQNGDIKLIEDTIERRDSTSRERQVEAH